MVQCTTQYMGDVLSISFENILIQNKPNSFDNFHKFEKAHFREGKLLNKKFIPENKNTLSLY